MLAIAAALISVNIWTGAPICALWIGAQFQTWTAARASGTGVSMEGLFAVVVVLAALEAALVLLVGRVSNAYDKLTGRGGKAHRRSPWLRSLGGERDKAESGRYGISAVERTAIISVVVCVLAFEAWFIFSPRSALPY
jgi:hypothetical protein